MTDRGAPAAQTAEASTPWYVRYLPTIAILAPAVLSLLAWFGPIAPGGLTGYFTRAPVTPWGVALVIVWFGGLIAVTQWGYARGRTAGPISALEAVSVLSVHRWTCAVGLFGTGWAYWIASGGSAARVVELWRTQQFNSLRAGFEYGVGVPTLRYATILAGALTVVHLATRGRPRLVDALSLIGLVAMSFLASRLAITAALSTALAVFVTGRTVRLPRPSAILAGGVIIVLLFTVLNYSRNAGTYRAQGVDSPFAMAALNAQSYLAAPSQVTLGFATAVMESEYAPARGGITSGTVLLPTYASHLASVESRGQISHLVDVSPSLTTNGALSDILFRDSWAALLAAAAGATLVAWAAARFLLSGGIGPAIGGILVYGLVELWRLFLLNQGIFHFLVLVGLLVVTIGKLKQAYPQLARLRSSP